MAKIAPVNLSYNPRTLWFSSNGIKVKKDDPVVVETNRGIEFGVAAGDVFEATKEQLDSLKSPLKPVLRLATENDVERAHEYEEKSLEAMPVFKEFVEELEMDMHPVSVEFLLDGDKAIFYFEAEERVDFRNLVRKLASEFHVRIDMRQIGVRDEARIIGGLGHCGQELCCKRFGGCFNPVSIRMAKEQDLSLNPQKISGRCGRLMCCLQYEYDASKDFKERAPKLHSFVHTPDGLAEVIELDTPREIVTVQIEGERPIKVPLADFKGAEKGKRPDAIGKAAWNLATSMYTLSIGGDPFTFLTSEFKDTGAAQKVSGRRGKLVAEGASKEGAKAPKRIRQRTINAQSRSQENHPEAKSVQPKASEGAKKTRRRSTRLNAASTKETSVPSKQEPQKASQHQNVATAAKPDKTVVAHPSPKKAKGSQKKSGKPANKASSARKSGSQNKDSKKTMHETSNAASSHRKPRMRTHTTGQSGSDSK
ncbi:MAG: hypothetical protein LUB61_06890 [Eggerthellaceae bacterium]|nr:hypothetical protein [Eggerthellaceae bacterium]